MCTCSSKIFCKQKLLLKLIKKAKALTSSNVAKVEIPHTEKKKKAGAKEYAANKDEAITMGPDGQMDNGIIYEVIAPVTVFITHSLGQYFKRSVKVCCGAWTCGNKVRIR